MLAAVLLSRIGLAVAASSGALLVPAAAAARARHEPAAGEFAQDDPAASTSTSTGGADEGGEGEADVIAPAREPPRIDGPYLGLVTYGGLVLVRVNDLQTGTPFGGGGGYIRFGQMVLPWLGLGLQGGGNGATRSERGARQTLGQGGLLVDFTFVPSPKRVQGLSLRASFGFGGGAVTQAGRPGRSGFGGAMFGAGVRYEFFPGVKNYRPTKGGGLGLGPELAWLGATPAARGRPMAHSIYVGLAVTFYFGD